MRKSDAPQVVIHKNDPKIDSIDTNHRDLFEFQEEYVNKTSETVWESLSPDEKIEKANIVLFKYAPFFGSILTDFNFVNVKKWADEKMSEEEREDIEDQIEDQLPSDADVSADDIVDGILQNGITTAAVDNKGNFYYDPEFIESLGSNECIGLMAHEVAHIVKLHMLRTDPDEMNQKIMNIAQDININFELDKYGFILPDVGYTPSYNEKEYTVFDPKEMPTVDDDDVEPLVLDDVMKETSETVYAKIEKWMDENNVTAEQLRKGDGEGIIVIDQEGDQNVSDSVEGTIERSRSRSDSRDQGDIGVDIYDTVKSKKKADTNYRRRISSLLQSEIPYDYQMHQKHKKSVTAGYHIPAIKKKDGRVRVIICLDTSGSISEQLLEKFGEEIRQLCSQFSQIDIFHIQHTAEVTYAEEELNVTEYDYTEVEIHGTGGTNHIPVFNYLESENKYRYSVFIGLTDGVSSFPDNKPKNLDDVLWVIPFSGADESEIPFGEVIRTRDKGRSQI